MKMDAALNELPEQRAVAVPEDYINPGDGLLYCGKCRTPKEAFFDENRRHGDFIKHTVLCKCAGEEAERKAAEEKKWKRQNYLQNLRAEAFSDIPAYTWRFESAAVLTPQLQKVKAYADRWEEFSRENIGLLLFGNVGTGKSYAAGCVANALLDRGISVRFIGLADAVNRMQGVMGEERERCIKYLMRPDLLIFDDLGAERSTSFGKERVFDLVNRRLLSGKPMIVTTNIPLYSIKNSEDVDCQRIYGRVLEACLPVNFDGANLRAAKAAQNNQRAIKMLSESESANAEKVIESPQTHQQ